MKKNILIIIFCILAFVAFSQDDSLCYRCLPIDSTAVTTEIEDTLRSWMIHGVDPPVTVEGSGLLDTLTVLIWSGSITCPVYTNNVTVMNAIKADFPALNIKTVYVIEPHPLMASRSPYGCFYWPVSNSMPQPYTMAERTQYRDTMLILYPHDFPVYIDGPCNQFWEACGTAHAAWYYVDATGTICASGLWFDDQSIRDAINKFGLGTGISESTSDQDPTGMNIRTYKIDRIRQGEMYIYRNNRIIVR